MKRIAAVLLWCLAWPVSAGIEEGRAIAHDQLRGNCLACHRIPADPSAVTEATLGPALKDLARRFPERAALRAQVADAAVRNPDTLMPLYGRHRILTDREIDLVVDYLLGL
jgi:sulfur-oxidizing protein SoxX